MSFATKILIEPWTLLVWHYIAAVSLPVTGTTGNGVVFTCYHAIDGSFGRRADIRRMIDEFEEQEETHEYADTMREALTLFIADYGDD